MLVVKSESLSKEYEPRFVIVDDAGVILDDAQGYGYTSMEKAHRAWAYKTNKKSRKRSKWRKRWWARHEEFSCEIADLEFRIAKYEMQGTHYTQEERYQAYVAIAKELGIDDFCQELMPAP